MPKVDSLNTLARTLIGVAWRDGHMSEEEKNILKDLTFSLPEITPDDWHDLDIYWITPVDDRALGRLTQELHKTLQHEIGRNAAKEMAHRLAAADGHISAAETAILRELDRAIDRNEPDIIDGLELLLENALPKRAAHLQKASDHQTSGQAFFRTQVFERLKARFGDKLEQKLNLDSDELQKLALTGALMGRVAYADEEIDDQEIALMERILHHGWGLSDEHTALVIEYALDAAQQPFDNPRLAREFYEATTYQERVDFLDVLFEVALAHGDIAPVEKAEIRRIAESLKLDESDLQLAYKTAKRIESRLLKT